MSEADPVAQHLLQRWANRGEAALALIRAGFIALVFVRLAFVGIAGSALFFDSFVLPIAFVVALWVFVLARRGRLEARFFIGSSLVEAVFCFLSLLTNVLWPMERYEGILSMPDSAVTVALVSLSALRLTPAASAASASANALSLVVLATIDRSLNPALVRGSWLELGMLLIYVAVSGVAAFAASYGARSLVFRTADETKRSEQAQRGLGALLREHHDVRTLISAARLQLDLELRERSSARLLEVRTALEQISEFVEAVKSRSFAELAALDVVATADAGVAAAAAAEAARVRFPAVRFVLPPSQSNTVQVAGGQRALSHVLFNLFINACEGDGARGAAEVRLGFVAAGADVAIEVRDDGPGFSEQQLATPAHLLSTKAEGSGHGLALAAEVMRSSGGELALSNEASGGGCVRLRLPTQRRST